MKLLINLTAAGCTLLAAASHAEGTKPQATPPSTSAETHSLDRQLAIAAANRDAVTLANLFGENGKTDTDYMVTAHIQGFKPYEDKVARAIETGKVSVEEGVAAIFAARVSTKACLLEHLQAECEIVGKQPQAELIELANRLD